MGGEALYNSLLRTIKGIFVNIIKLFLLFLTIILQTTLCSFAENKTATADFSFYLPEYLHIIPLTSPALTANVTNRNGNLDLPLHSSFRVITNTAKTKTLYLQANTVTEAGYESAMFIRGGQVYIAFANLKKIPTSSALANCKFGTIRNDSPGVVAYPIVSVTGAENKFITDKNKYEVYVENGKTDIGVSIGRNVLATSFGNNDPKGFYQAILSLTETDI